MNKVRLVIIGGGCAGLSLARRLSKFSAAPHTIVIEPRPEYVEDRTWCYWNGQDCTCDHLIQKRWPTVSVSSGQHTAVIDLNERNYQLLRSLDFYQDSHALIESSDRVSLKCDESVVSVVRLSNGGWRTQTTRGSYESDFIIDTRPYRATDQNPPTLWQTFLGFEVECDESVFESTTANLMDFGAVDGTDIPFVYILPIDEQRALFELTILSPLRQESSGMVAPLLEAIQDKIGSIHFTIVREEFGAIPMGLSKSPAPADPTYCHVGMANGSARPSSGYAFCRIQQWADSCCESLMKGGGPLSPKEDTRLVQFMDRVFLQVLRRHPALAPDLFLRMFKWVPPARLLRFLCDNPSLIDALSMVRSLPKLVFIREYFNIAVEPFVHSRTMTCSR
ncbi:MAG: lycopene cyclase family protein [Armatimonadota bacterium]